MTASQSKKFIYIGMLLMVAVECLYIAMPYPAAPYSLLIVIPSFISSNILGEKIGFIAGGAIASFIPALIFLLCTSVSLKTNKAIPKLSIIIFLSLFAGAIILAILGFNITVQYTSLTRAILLVSQSVGVAIALASVVVLGRNSITTKQSLIWHWFVFAWLGCAAFPMYGELP